MISNPLPLFFFSTNILRTYDWVDSRRAGSYLSFGALSERQLSIWHWGWETKQRRSLEM